jgi:toxin ParE1/3/4
MDWQLIWSERARSDLNEIHQYIAQHNTETARRTINEVLERVELLQTVPRMGRVYKAVDQIETRVIVCGKYRVFYDLNEADRQVEILTVRHHARAEPDLS